MKEIPKLSEEQQKWVDSRPKKIRDLIAKFPPHICYRDTEGKGHYKLYSYSEEEESGKVSVKMVHGRDSFLPGIMVFGVYPEEYLVECGCGKWEAPTKPQIEVTKAQIDLEKVGRDP